MCYGRHVLPAPNKNYTKQKADANSSDYKKTTVQL